MLYRMLLAIFIVLIIRVDITSQSCLPDGIEFTSQTEVDNFPSNYPSCTEIDGDLLIMYGAGINNLDSLYPLSKINGNLWIYSQPELYSLSGLHNIDSIIGELDITDCENISSLSGLESLEFVGDGLYIIFNSNLTSLNGIEDIDYLGGNGLFIIINDNLTDISALENCDLSTIERLYIYRNETLSECNTNSLCTFFENPTGIVNIYENATGCNNSSEIALSCSIPPPCLPYGNYFLYSQEDVDNFPINYPGCTILNGSVKIRFANDLYNLNSIVGINGGLSVNFSNSLTSLEGLHNLEYVSGVLELDGTGLNNIEALADLESDSLDLLRIRNNGQLSNCSILSVCSFFDNEDGTFEVYNNALGCNNPVEIADSCNISFDCLSNGNYLFEYQEQVDEFPILYPTCVDLQGDVIIEGDEITNLDGLSQIESINGDLILHNCPFLEDFTGLSNITGINGELSFWLNPLLENLDMFENLDYVNKIRLSSNYILTSISGLENINSDSLSELNFYYNSLLSNCSIESICNYLEIDTALARIEYNAPNCNSREEVEGFCVGVSVEEESLNNSMSLYPNPTTYEFFINVQENEQVSKVRIYNNLGQSLLESENIVNGIKISFLEPGNYIVEITSKNKQIIRKKLIIY